MTAEDSVAWRNRRILAERLGWPAGALETCEQLDRDFPDWCVWWLRESDTVGWEHPAGFYASMPALLRQRDGGGWERPNAFAGTADELVELMRTVGEKAIEEHEQRYRLRALPSRIRALPAGRQPGE